MISIRWKIILLCIVVLLLPILALNYYSVHTFDRFASRDLEEHMIDSAFFVGEQWKFEISSAGSNSPAVSAQFVDVLRRSAREVGARIQLLSSAGQVLVDSDTNAVLHSDLSSLPEVAGFFSEYGVIRKCGSDHIFRYRLAFEVEAELDIVVQGFNDFFPAMRILQGMVSCGLCGVNRAGKENGRWQRSHGSVQNRLRGCIGSRKSRWRWCGLGFVFLEFHGYDFGDSLFRHGHAVEDGGGADGAAVVCDDHKL